MRSSAVQFVCTQQDMFEKPEDVEPWRLKMSDPFACGDDRTWSALVQVLSSAVTTKYVGFQSLCLIVRISTRIT